MSSHLALMPKTRHNHGLPVVCWRHCSCHFHHLWTVLLATVLITETSYFTLLCTYGPSTKHLSVFVIAVWQCTLYLTVRETVRSQIGQMGGMCAFVCERFVLWNLSMEDHIRRKKRLIFKYTDTQCTEMIKQAPDHSVVCTNWVKRLRKGTVKICASLVENVVL